MNTYLQMPKVEIIIILLLFFFVVTSVIGLPIALFLLATCVGCAVVLDIVFTYERRKKFFKPFAAIVTGLILALIIDPSAAWYQILAICAAAMALKNFVRIGNRHIFNPAASGLVVGWVLFGLQPSWWGATLYSGDTALLNIVIYVLLAAIAYVSCYKLGRYNSVVSYIVVYTVLFTLITSSLSVSSLIQTMVSPGMLFYALLMLCEPMTSPVNKKRQLLYGSTVAGLNAIFLYVSFGMGISNIPDASLLALLIGNLLFFKLR